MKKIFITAANGYNIIGDNVDEILNKIYDRNIDIKENKQAIPDVLTKQEKSGKDNYSVCALTACKLLFQQISIENLNKYAIGSVFTSEYGAIHTNLKFLNALYTEGADFVSPRQFTNTVNNSCLGAVCINYKIKGASTMFVNTFPITYSIRLFESGKTEAVLVGAIDEYDKELYEDFASNDILKDGWYSGSAFLFLENNTSITKTKNTVIGELVSSANVIDGFGKYKARTIPISIETMKQGMRKALNKAKIKPEDLAGVFMTANAQNRLYYNEKQAILELCSSLKCIPLNSLFHVNGMVEGILDIAIALQCLKEKRFPKITENELQIEYSEEKYVMINS